MPRTDEFVGIKSETILMEGHDGDRIHAYLAQPAGEGPFPSVVLFHHLPGWDELYREFAHKFAYHGYIAICPDLYCREGHGTWEEVAAMARANGWVADDQVVGDGEAGIDYVRAMPNSNGKVALVGTCSGGRHAYLTACRTDRPVDAVVDCWGGKVVAGPEQLSEKQPVAPVDHTPSLNAPVLGIFGDKDASPSPADVDALEAALQANGVEYEFHRYPEAGHGIFYHDRPDRYHAESAVDAWEKLWAFLDRTMG